MRARRWAATIAAGAALTTGVSMTSATSAAAVSCTSPATRNADEGSGVLKGTYGLKVAPYASCGTVTTMFEGDVLYFHCWYQNAYGNDWAFGRIKGTNIHGWMSEANFSSYSTDLWPSC
ncbi:hypothetical protein ACIPM2_09580 [Streptomyces sp. NPDC086081]|uniref:hypothetical protein n=1 Tax=Streptomyces sp. NPDC086081 TaxID=3365749 RepID=UPI00382F43E9